MREFVLYVPVGGYSATGGIARGSAIVGEPRADAVEVEVEVHFEGAIHGQENMRTLADRATHAASRMLEGYTTSASRIVPRDALVAVGTFDFGEGRITLTGADSESAVATWLGTLRLDPAELANRSLGEALIERVGIGHDGEEERWVDGRLEEIGAAIEVNRQRRGIRLRRAHRDFDLS
jgi:hypothetical protein